MTGLAIGLALLLVSFAAADSLPPNELGRVMILEYHKIDRPENRWTRTPENFRRDLERLWERGYRLVGLNDFLDGKIALPAGATPGLLTFDDPSPHLSRYPESVVRSQIASAQEWIQRHVPGYRPRPLALPMGASPRETRWAEAGTVNGPAYRHDAILMVAGGAAPSPFARTFDPYRLPRIQALESELGRWLSYFEKNPQERYVSDGDPGFITVPAGSMDKVKRSIGVKVVERP